MPTLLVTVVVGLLTSLVAIFAVSLAPYFSASNYLTKLSNEVFTISTYFIFSLFTIPVFGIIFLRKPAMKRSKAVLFINMAEDILKSKKR